VSATMQTSPSAYGNGSRGRRALLLSAALLLAIAGPAAAEDAKRHVESAGKFSYVAPAGWQVRAMPGLKFQIAHGEPVEGFAPNLNFVDETYAGSLQDYVAGNLQELATQARRFTPWPAALRCRSWSASGMRH